MSPFRWEVLDCAIQRLQQQEEGLGNPWARAVLQACLHQSHIVIVHLIVVTLMVVNWALLLKVVLSVLRSSLRADRLA